MLSLVGHEIHTDDLNDPFAEPFPQEYSVTRAGEPVKSSLAQATALLIALVAVLLIVHTYSVFDQSYDESPHIGPGMEWLVHHTYTLDPLNSPFPRAVVALGPWLLGATYHNIGEPTLEGNAILFGPHYHRILVAARLGTLTFFLFAVYLVWSRARSWLGEWPAAIALLLFCTVEPVLAHSSQATTDISVMTMFFWSIDRLYRLAQKPTLRTSLMAGLACGISLTCKHTAAPFFVVALILFALYYWLLRERGSLRLALKHPVLKPKFWLPTLALSVFILWAMYFFTIGPVFPPGSQDEQKTTHALHKLHIPRAPVFAILDHLPAPGYFTGIRNARASDHTAKPSYLLGHISYRGKHYFYAVALLVKTPIPFLLIGFAGIFFALQSLYRRDHTYATVMLIGATAPFLFMSMTHINMGLRHVLLVYPFIAVLGAWAVTKLWTRGVARQATIVMLLTWQIAACIIASPDYIPYFNELAAPHADYFLVDSDFDWGQDLKRLPPVLNHLGATNVAIAYAGTDSPTRQGIANWHVMTPADRHGWFVVSDLNLKEHPETYGWLTQYKPAAIAGKSLFVFHVD